MDIELVKVITDLLVYSYFGWTYIGKKLGLAISRLIKPRLQVTTINKEGVERTCILKKGMSPEVDQLIDAVHQQASEHRQKKGKKGNAL